MKTSHFQLTPESNEYLNNLCGPFDENLRHIEHHFAVEISHRGHAFKIIGPDDMVDLTQSFLGAQFAESSQKPMTKETLNLACQSVLNQAKQTESKPLDNKVFIQAGKNVIKPQGINQQRYIKRVSKYDVNFGIGPAGTGKTFLGVAAAVQALEQEQVRRLILVRPAVEAGESLGFLPGDLAQKVDPYLRPIYDALYELMGFDTVARLLEKRIIEIAPLAYMRGRTLNDAFIILDESQNTTPEQMKMFLTRIGFNSTVVITGDITQVDLPRGKKSGLRHAIEVLDNTPEISFTFFERTDVVRHPLIQTIVAAYDKFEGSDA